MSDPNANKPGYKETKAGWIPDDWVVEKLGRLMEIGSGYAFSSGHFGDIGALLLTPGNFTIQGRLVFDQRNTKRYSGPIPKNTTLPQGALVIVMTDLTPTCNLLGKPAFVRCEEPVLHNQRIGRISRSSEAVTDDFLFWHFLSEKHAVHMKRTATGTTVRHTSNASIYNSYVALPPLNEQRSINQILSSCDEAIEKTGDLIKAKQRQKKALMQQLLTGKKRLPGFEDEWEQVRLRKLLSVRDERLPKSDDYSLYSLTIEDGITPKTDRYDREALVRDKDAKKYKVVHPGDVVFNPANLRWGAIGRSEESRPVLVSPIYEVLHVSKNAKVSCEFLFLRLSWERQIRKFASVTEGGLVERQAVKLDTFLSTFVELPSRSEQEAIAKVLLDANQEISLLREKEKSLKDQKKALMQKLLTGQVRVKV